MTKQKFEELCQKGLVYLDGATGSNLQQMGMSAGVCPEEWILKHEDIFMQLQTEFLEAGSHILYAPTFGANQIKLAQYHLQESVEEINKNLVRLSKKVAGNRAYVAGDLTMTGKLLEPCGNLEFEELVNIYKEQILCLEKSGVDLFIIETIMTLQEARAALIAAKEVSDLPVMITLTFTEDGNTLYGTSPEATIVTLQALGASAVGANCSLGPDKMIKIIKRMKKYAKVPLIAKPNAGTPRVVGNENAVYTMSSKEYSKYMRKLVYAGANIVGGCCGTTPSYIEEMVRNTQNCSRKTLLQKDHEYISSSRKICIGEYQFFKYIDVQRNSKLYKDAKKGDYESILDILEESIDKKNQIFKISIPSSTKQEKIIHQNLLQEVIMHYDIPLCVDFEDEEILDRILRLYSGRAFVDLRFVEGQKSMKLIKICQKYGAFLK